MAVWLLMMNDEIDGLSFIIYGMAMVMVWEVGKTD